MTARTLKTGVVLALGAALLLSGVPCAAADPPAESKVITETSRRNLAEIRRLAGCLAESPDDSGVEIRFRGRSAVEIKGRERGANASGTIRDLARFDPTAGRIVAYTCFANASTRKSGEAIISLAEVSSRADGLVRVILPGANLELASIERRRSGETESIYYEARYISASVEFSFFEPPVRLLLNATTGVLYQLDIDPDWLDPAAPPRVRIARKAAELIAKVVLRGKDLAPAFGSGASLGTFAAAEMFTIRPNDWLGFYPEHADARARVAWVVPFRVDGGNAAGIHHIFIDAASGRILGGLSDRSARPAPRDPAQHEIR